MENKYQNGKIYKIVCNETGKIYIGSTIQSLNNRLSNHKSHYNGYLQGKNRNYTTSFEIIETNNYHIELICDYPCSCKKELETMEAKYIREIECINKCIPCRPIEEKKEYKKQYSTQYYEQNRDKIKELMKQYNEQNKEYQKEYQKEYRKQYREKNKDKIKEYREQNKDKIKEYNKQYKEQNKDKIKDKIKEYKEQNKDKLKEYRKEYYKQYYERNKKIKYPNNI